MGWPVVRNATLEDVRAMAEVVDAAWRSAYKGVVRGDALDIDIDVRVARIRRRSEEGVPSYVAESNGQVVGVARLGWIPPPIGFDASIDGLYVHPSAQRSGVGQALVRHCCGVLNGRAQRTLYIQVLRDNVKARAFYEKIGGRVILEDTWSYGGVSYPAVGYGWDDLAELARLFTGT